MIGAVPIVGTVGAEMFNRLIAPPLQKRQQEWMDDVATELRRLAATNRLRLEDLPNNPAFVDAVMTASQAAIRTSQREKRDALRNAVLRSALPGAPDIDIQQIFLGLIDRLSVNHLRVLQLFQNPTNWFGVARQSVNWQQFKVADDILHVAFPDLKVHHELGRQIWTELYAAGLVDIHTLVNPGEGDRVMKKRTTPYADQLLRFIESPFVG